MTTEDKLKYLTGRPLYLDDELAEKLASRLDGMAIRNLVLQAQEELEQYVRRWAVNLLSMSQKHRNEALRKATDVPI